MLEKERERERDHTSLETNDGEVVLTVTVHTGGAERDRVQAHTGERRKRVEERMGAEGAEGCGREPRAGGKPVQPTRVRGESDECRGGAAGSRARKREIARSRKARRSEARSATRRRRE